MLQQRVDVRCDMLEQKITQLEAEVARLQRVDQQWQYWRTWFIRIYKWVWASSRAFPWSNEEPKAVPVEETPDAMAADP